MAAHDALLASAPDSSWFFYSDGSLMEGRVGAGLAIRMKVGDEVAWGRQWRGMGQYQTVYAGELDGIRLALDSILALLDTNPNIARDLHLFVDNQSALANACDPFKGPGQHQRQLNRDLYLRLCRDWPLVRLFLHWIPGHVDCEGNEQADEWAKAGAAVRFDGKVEARKGKQKEVTGVTRVRGQVGAGGRRESVEADAGEGLPGGDEVAKSVLGVKDVHIRELKALWAEQWAARNKGAKLRQVNCNPASSPFLTGECGSGDQL